VSLDSKTEWGEERLGAVLEPDGNSSLSFDKDLSLLLPERMESYSAVRARE
jgi:hypothetical protein